MSTTCPECGSGIGEPHKNECTCREFPGWTPELGRTRYGYPLPPSMQGLSADQVLGWGREALDLLGRLLLTDLGNIPEDTDWMIDARCWADCVLGKVSEVVGSHASALDQYAATVKSRVMLQLKELEPVILEGEISEDPNGEQSK